ncbi:twin-arginine translocation signal domain-containing protein [Candidatus Latescibacterota bacterium]
MGQTRRKFMKDAACAGAVMTAGTALSINESEASELSAKANDLKCPYFDQPLMCTGPDDDGKYKCDI